MITNVISGIIVTSMFKSYISNIYGCILAVSGRNPSSADLKSHLLTLCCIFCPSVSVLWEVLHQLQLLTVSPSAQTPWDHRRRYESPPTLIMLYLWSASRWHHCSNTKVLAQSRPLPMARWTSNLSLVRSFLREAEEEAGGADGGRDRGAEGETETDSDSTRDRTRGRRSAQTAGSHLQSSGMFWSHPTLTITLPPSHQEQEEQRRRELADREEMQRWKEEERSKYQQEAQELRQLFLQELKEMNNRSYHLETVRGV